MRTTRSWAGMLRALEGGNLHLLLRHAAPSDPALHSLRHLIDVLATAAEQPAGGDPGDAA
ncbi:hypothetical protein ACFXD5_23490 [Streptomyces sp. NPDC059385]|uniref:hypothetical protein n=1 Tax=Streptomyces sp. NPDC059385 TaxID=3346817 RepID=UPI00367A3314